MIVLKSYFNKKKIKVNYTFFTFSFFFIFILLISYFTFNLYIESNEKEEYKTIQISNSNLEFDEILNDIKENKNIVKSEKNDDSFIILIDKYENLLKVERYFLQKNYNVALNGNSPNIQLYSIQNFLIYFIILFILLMLCLLFKFSCNIIKEDKIESYLLYCLGYNLLKIKTYIFLKLLIMLIPAYFLSFLLSLLCVFIFNIFSVIKVSICIIATSFLSNFIVLFILIIIDSLIIATLKITNKKELS